MKLFVFILSHRQNHPRRILPALFFGRSVLDQEIRSIITHFSHFPCAIVNRKLSQHPKIIKTACNRKRWCGGKLSIIPRGVENHRPHPVLGSCPSIMLRLAEWQQVFLWQTGGEAELKLITPSVLFYSLSLFRLVLKGAFWPTCAHLRNPAEQIQREPGTGAESSGNELFYGSLLDWDWALRAPCCS